MTTSAGCFLALALIGTAGAAGAHDDYDKWLRGGDNWVRTDDVGRNPITRTTQKSWEFSKTGRVEVREIGGSVQVNAGDAGTVDMSYERSAASQQDYDCDTLRYEPGKDSLRIWVETKRVPECRLVRAREKLTLTVPRGAQVSLREIGDSVKVTGLAGLLRIGSVGDSAVLSDVRQLQAESIGDTLKLDVSTVGTAGIYIESVGDSVELNLPQDLDARLRIDSVGDEIRGPGLRWSHKDDDGTFETVLGKGGPLISIESVGDSVVIKGPSLKGRD